MDPLSFGPWYTAELSNSKTFRMIFDFEVSKYSEKLSGRSFTVEKNDSHLKKKVYIFTRITINVIMQTNLKNFKKYDLILDYYRYSKIQKNHNLNGLNIKGIK